MTTVYIALIGDLLVLRSFLIICHQTTKFSTTVGQYNQDKVVNFDIKKGIAIFKRNKFDMQCILLDLWNFVHLCSNKK